MYCDGIKTVVYIQNACGEYDWMFVWLTITADPRYALLLIFPLTFCFDKHLGLKIFWASSVTEWLNAILKW